MELRKEIKRGVQGIDRDLKRVSDSLKGKLGLRGGERVERDVENQDCGYGARYVLV